MTILECTYTTICDLGWKPSMSHRNTYVLGIIALKGESPSPCSCRKRQTKSIIYRDPNNILMFPARIQLAPKRSSTWYNLNVPSLLPRAPTSLYHAPSPEVDSASEIYSITRNAFRPQKFVPLPATYSITRFFAPRQPKRTSPAKLFRHHKSISPTGIALGPLGKHTLRNIIV